MQSKTQVYETIIETLEYQLEKLSQGSTEKQGLEDELITKQRESKGVGSSSTIKTKLPKFVIMKSSMELISTGSDSGTRLRLK